MLARQTSAQLYTTDFNLAKVAEVEGVKVLNVNELAQRLKPNVLPGEHMQIAIIQKGSGRGQGVGYADDGTMVVVEQADRMMGKSIDVVVDRMHNTLAGKMIFAKLSTPAREQPRPASPKPSIEKKVAQNQRPPKRFVPKKKAEQKEATDDGFVSDLRKEIS